MPDKSVDKSVKSGISKDIILWKKSK